MTDRLAKLENLVAADPADAFCLYGLAMEYAKAGREDEALARFDDAISVDPDYCYAYYHKARLLDDMDRTDDALQAANTGLQRARAIGEEHAASELAALLDELS